MVRIDSSHQLRTSNSRMLNKLGGGGVGECNKQERDGGGQKTISGWGEIKEE